MADVHELLTKYRKAKKAANAQRALTPSFGVGAYHRQPGGRVWAPARAPAQHARPAARPAQPARRAPAPAYAYGYPPRGGYVGDAPAPANVPAPTADPYYPNGNPTDPSNPPGSPGQYPPGPTGGAPYPHGQTYPQPECDPCGHGVTMHCETPTPCGANAIGQTTFGSDGIPPGVVTPVVVTAGDAKSFKPTKLFFEAMPWASPDLIDTDRLRGRSSLPLFLVDALVGRKSQLRRGGSPALGISQSAYANSKEIELVDWEEFTSTTEHNLSLLFFNPNKDIPVHASVVLWGDI
ncbi:MAG: hypothetical protein ACE37F_25340 [Nannocystaceae bacterium]|nr:hypothetical protein [bacterium]